MRLPDMILQFPPDRELAKRYNYAPYIDKESIDDVVKYLDPDRILIVSNKSNIFRIFDLIFSYERTEAIPSLFLKYALTKNEIGRILSSYDDEILPLKSMQYLFGENIYTKPTIAGIDT